MVISRRLMTRTENKSQRLIRQKKRAKRRRYFYITYLVHVFRIFIAERNEKCNECLEQIVWVISLLFYINKYILLDVLMHLLQSHVYVTAQNCFLKHCISIMLLNS